MSTFNVNPLPQQNIMVLDTMNVAFRYRHKGQTRFAEDYLSTVRSLARSYECGTVVVAADWGGSSYRKEIFPEYKANRKELVDAQTKEEKEASEKFFKEFERALELFDEAKGITLLRYKGVEADDIAAYIVSMMPDYGFDKAWLISSDADWDLLISDKVSRFSTVTRKEYTSLTWDYPVSMEEYISYKVLIGDKGDNIPGIPGVGPKRAAALIEQYGSAMDIYANCPLDGKYKYIQAVNEHKEQILKNYELMDLVTYCKDAIGHDNINDIGRALVMG